MLTFVCCLAYVSVILFKMSFLALKNETKALLGMLRARYYASKRFIQFDYFVVKLVLYENDVWPP